MDEIPLLAEDLIKGLDELYPPLTADEVLTLDERALTTRAARRQVVEFLLMRLSQQQDDDLNVQ